MSSNPSHKGLIAALLTLALVIVACTVALLVGFTGDEDGDGDGVSSTEEPTAQPTPPAGVTLDGDGYTVSLPEGWENAPPTSNGDASRLPGTDLMAQLVTGEDRGANLTIVKRTAPGATRPEHALDDWKSIQFTKVQGKKVEVDPIDLDGSRALGVQSWATTEAGHHVTYHEFMTVHDGSLHAFTYTSLAQYETSITEVLDMIENTWTWE